MSVKNFLHWASVHLSRRLRMLLTVLADWSTVILYLERVTLFYRITGCLPSNRDFLLHDGSHRIVYWIAIRRWWFWNWRKRWYPILLKRETDWAELLYHPLVVQNIAEDSLLLARGVDFDIPLIFTIRKPNATDSNLTNNTVTNRKFLKKFSETAVSEK